MTMPVNHRFIYVCELKLRPTPKDAPAIDIRDLFKEVKKQFDSKGLLVHKYEEGAIKLSIKDMALTKDHVVLLFNLRNKYIADQYQQDEKTGTSRAFPKKATEAPAVSAHVIINFNSTNAAGDTYPLLIENTDGISNTAINLYFRDLFKMLYTQTFTRKAKKSSKKDEDIEYRPYTELLGYQSNTLENALNGGAQINDVELITVTEMKQGFDEEPLIVEKEETLTYKVKVGTTGKKGINFIKNIPKVFGTDYSRAKIRITMPNGKTKTSPLDLKKTDLNEQALILQEFVDGFTDLPSCAGAIRQDLVSKMLKCTSKQYAKVS